MLAQMCAGIVRAALTMTFVADVALVPAWSAWQQMDATYRGDAGSYSIHVAHSLLSVSQGGEQLWHAPLSWHVTCAFVCDLEGDGVDEVVALAWRRGSFGSSHPFWIEPDNDLGQHVYVLDWNGSALQQRWTSSALHAQVAQASMDDDGTLELTTTSGKTTHWYWDGWGFTLIDDEEQGGQ